MNRGAAVAVSALLLALVVVGGCGNAGAATDMARLLEYEGYTAVSVRMDSDGRGDVVTIRTQGHPELADADAVGNAQTMVWNSLPRRFDLLDVRVGNARQEVDYQRLAQRFGLREEGLSDRGVGADLSAMVVTASMVAGLVVALVILVWLMLRRRRRWEEQFQLPAPVSGPTGAR